MTSKAKRPAQRKAELARRARRIRYRNEEKKTKGDNGPVLGRSEIEFEYSERVRALSTGGVAAVHKMVQRLGLPEAINKHVHVLKRHLPYYESDHVLNIAYNFVAGGKCLDDIEERQNSEEYLDVLGADRIPDPTTAGDFLRRFESSDVEALMESMNGVRLDVWDKQGEDFFDQATLHVDGTLLGTNGECKQGADFAYDGTWGYHPLMVSLAETQEPLFLRNRAGNRPSNEGASRWLNEAISLTRDAGFKKILLVGDTDFSSQTAHFDGWTDDDVDFIFGYDAYPVLKTKANSLDEDEWQPLERPSKYEVKTEPREKPENVKERVVKERGYKNVSLNFEEIAEFEYCPGKCDRAYRMIVVKKNLTQARGEQAIFDEERFFFYITNDFDMPAEEVVFTANARCDQENLIRQLKNDVPALDAPSNTLESNWAYMVIVALAWNLKAWFGLLLPDETPTGLWTEKYMEEKQEVLRMGFKRFYNYFIKIPVQIVETGRNFVCRILAWNPYQQVFNRFLEVLEQPLRC